MDNLTNVLTHLMSKNKISSSELARQTGVAQPVIYRLMSGGTENPQILTLKPIADYFSLSIDQLMGYKPLTITEPLNRAVVHEINNKLTTIKTIASTLIDLLPKLAYAYQIAFNARLVANDIPLEILPLLELNAGNLIKAADFVSEKINSEKLSHGEQE
jgi:transcriptional regulator with XRE-family HTH domain